MSASFTLYVLWLFMTVLALLIVVVGGADKGVRYARRSGRDPNRIAAKR
jgi:hypothetical protein